MSLLNGFLITDIPRTLNHIQYRGIENNPWPLCRELLESTLYQSQLEHFDRQTDDLYIGEKAIALIDFETAQIYLKACDQHYQSVDVKYIEIIRDNQTVNEELSRQYAVPSRLLGYDVGECSGDYYSCLFSDIIARPKLLGDNIYHMINHNGLFNSITDANIYLKNRGIAQKHSPIYMFESGQMDIMAVYSAEISR